MAKAVYWQKGEALDHKNSTQVVIEAGTLIPLGPRVGVAGNRINPGETGSVHMVGVFSVEKGSQVFQTGQLVYLASNAVTGDEKTGETVNPLIGYAVAEAPASDTAVFVKLLG